MDWNFGPPEVKVLKWRIGWAAKLYIDRSLYNELQNANFIHSLTLNVTKFWKFFRNFSDFQNISRLFSVITTTTVPDLSPLRFVKAYRSVCCNKDGFSGFELLWCSEKFFGQGRRKIFNLKFKWRRGYYIHLTMSMESKLENINSIPELGNLRIFKIKPPVSHVPTHVEIWQSLIFRNIVPKLFFWSF